MNLVTVKEVIRVSRLAVNNAHKDTDTAKKLAGVGINDKSLRELENLTNLVEEVENSKALCYNEGMRISEQIEKNAQALFPVFKDHVATVRYAFRHEPTLVLSFVSGRISNNKWQWLAQAHQFYTNIMPYVGQLEPHGLGLEELQQAQVSVEALMGLREDRLQKKGEAEDCTHNRDKAVKQLKRKLKAFHTAARLALHDSPQKLEAFGIMVKTQKV